ncbi:putative pectinesterase/pectinesterase inhibitor 34 [Ananas comosus]|uniref:Pectinesterase n=1 Tax=Ananas comosus TaxID=4615 RepID=A0A199VU47_ANACO|nr:putative pectinesterase/pectinesterase inhibitor 34 [Ananas comosus]
MACCRFLVVVVVVDVFVLLLLAPNSSTSLPSPRAGPALECLPGAPSSGEGELVRAALNATARRVGHALYGAASALVGGGAGPADALARAAAEDCVELLGDSLALLSRSLLSLSRSRSRSRPASDDVRTWLSAALTNQDTCEEGLDAIRDRRTRIQLQAHFIDLRTLLSSALAVFAAAGDSGEFSGIPIQDKKKAKRVLLRPANTDDDGRKSRFRFPEWVTRKDRRLLQSPGADIKADMVVDSSGGGGGNGTFARISDAVEAAPENSERRIVIYVKAGTYYENVKVGRKKTNLMFVGDGKGETIVAAGRSFADNYTTYRTATFAATGAGFIMKDMTVENWAGPEKHQAVALRVGADQAVVYRCNIIGYQDTLYVHSQRQFFRECDIYGTVDFIFGNAAVVLQNCSIWARKPLPMQKNTVTAQNRKDPNQNTGISIHACRVEATPDLEPVKSSYPTYLGRPWKLYSRTVYMQSYMGDHIHPAGWLEWNATFALDTLYYGEYMNYGPGAALANRVTWPGYRVITSPEEANKFTVAQFIYGSSWLPSTGVSFLAGLSE